jgi:hypothetical protein
MVLKPGYYPDEPLVGVLVGLPYCWLGLVGVIAATITFCRSRTAVAPMAGPAERKTRLFLWCVAASLVLCTNSAFPLLFLFMPSMRQLGDINSGLILLGTLGAWWLLDRFRIEARRRRVVAAVIAILSTLTIAFGLLLGYEGYGKHFHTYNPRLDEKLTHTLSFCPR